MTLLSKPSVQNKICYLSKTVIYPTYNLGEKFEFDFQFDGKDPKFSEQFQIDGEVKFHTVFGLEVFIDNNDTRGSKADDPKLKFLFVYQRPYEYKNHQNVTKKGYPWCMVEITLAEILIHSQD